MIIQILIYLSILCLFTHWGEWAGSKERKDSIFKFLKKEGREDLIARYLLEQETK